MYATAEDIQADFKEITFTETTSITTEDVEQFIVESDALINAYISNRYVTPVVTGTQGLALLKLLTRSLTAARVKRILEVKQEKNADPNQNVLGVLLSVSKVMEILKALQDGDSNLVDSPELVADRPVGFHSENVSSGVEFVAKKDERQW